MTNPAAAAMDPVALAIAQAQNAANAANAATTSTAVAPANGGSTAVGMPTAPGKKLSMESLQTGAMNVDKWLKVKEFGLLIGDKPDLIESMVVSINMTEGVGFTPKFAIKAGNPAQYFYTLDNVSCAQGGSWDAAIQKATALDNKARPYPCVDLPFTVHEEVKKEVKGKPDVVLAEVGLKLGYTTSTTNWKAWEQFYKEVAAAGLMNSEVLVKLGFEAKTNKANNTWGIVTFELLGEVGE